MQAAILSYGAFDIYKSSIEGFETFKNPFWLLSRSKPRGIFGIQFNAEKNSNMYQALSPIYTIPKREDRVLPPQFFMVGSKDSLTTPASVRQYIEKLESFDHKTEYWEYGDKNHAFLDSSSNFFLGSNFEENAPQAIDKMIDFLNRVFE